MRLYRFLILMILFTFACSSGTGHPTTPPASSSAPTSSPDLVTKPAFVSSPTAALEFSQTAEIPAIAPPTASPSPAPGEQTCSPLEGYELDQIDGAIANPYHPPRPGSDDPHQGIDIADTTPGEKIALAGRTEQAVLNGTVAMVVHDRFPYGNAVLIETPLDSLPEVWKEAVPIPTLAPTFQPLPALTCPAGPAPQWDFGQRSLYLLYAHMQEPATVQTGEPVSCGQAIGLVGNSGNALNPHLHLEARLGPSGWRPDSMAHYDSSASPEEMQNYCTWRVTGVFQLVDPLMILHTP